MRDQQVRRLAVHIRGRHYGFSRMRKAIVQGVTLLGESEPRQGEEWIHKETGPRTVVIKVYVYLEIRPLRGSRSSDIPIAMNIPSPDLVH